MEEKDASLPGERTQPANQPLHQSQEEEEQRSSGSLALTTRSGPSTRAPAAASQGHTPRSFSCRTSAPR